MNLTPVDILVVTALAVCAGLAFTVWKFNAGTPHARATTRLLKGFFDGKQCAICHRPIPPVHRMGLKPGLFNPKTHETHSWDEISNVDLSTALENHLPVCSGCEVTESFRQRYPGLVTDHDRSLPHAPPDTAVTKNNLAEPG